MPISGTLCRWAECEAYRTSNSDLRLLRQLLLEDGFWCTKDEADARYRAQRKLAVASAAAADAAPPAAQVSATVGNNDLENSPEEHAAESDGARAEAGASDELPTAELLRQSGRGSRFVPAWLSPPEPAPKV